MIWNPREHLLNITSLGDAFLKSLCNSAYLPNLWNMFEEDRMLIFILYLKCKDRTLKLRHLPMRGVDCPLDGELGEPRVQDQQTPPAVHWSRAAWLRPRRPAQVNQRLRSTITIWALYVAVVDTCPTQFLVTWCAELAPFTTLPLTTRQYIFGVALRGIPVIIF